MSRGKPQRKDSNNDNEQLKTMDRGDIWNAAWDVPSVVDRILLIGRWEDETGNRYYDGEPRKEKKFRADYEAVKNGGVK